jgi:hypothetical protein
MNPEFEKYIDMALVDGVVTETEKAFLLKKANELGIEKDEFEFILNSKIQMKEKELQKSSPPTPPTIQSAPKNSKSNSQKEGDIKKCPACGASVKSFSSKCLECDHEFRNVGVVSSVTEFYNEYKKIGEEIKEYKPLAKSWWGSNNEKATKLFEVQTRQRDLVSNFPIPNTKEDIFEFLGLCIANKNNFTIHTWKDKAKQIIMKAKITLSNDKNAIAEIQSIAKQLRIKWDKI